MTDSFTITCKKVKHFSGLCIDFLPKTITFSRKKFLSPSLSAYLEDERMQKSYLCLNTILSRQVMRIKKMSIRGLLIIQNQTPQTNIIRIA